MMSPNRPSQDRRKALNETKLYKPLPGDYEGEHIYLLSEQLCLKDNPEGVDVPVSYTSECPLWQEQEQGCFYCEHNRFRVPMSFRSDAPDCEPSTDS